MAMGKLPTKSLQVCKLDEFFSQFTINWSFIVNFYLLLISIIDYPTKLGQCINQLTRLMISSIDRSSYVYTSNPCLLPWVSPNLQFAHLVQTYLTYGMENHHPSRIYSMSPRCDGFLELLSFLPSLVRDFAEPSWNRLNLRRKEQKGYVILCWSNSPSRQDWPPNHGEDNGICR